MPFRINPIMAGLIVALPNLVLAVEHGQITINDPSGATTIVLIRAIPSPMPARAPRSTFPSLATA